jgi:sugar phosphate isomerase/epimerase
LWHRSRAAANRARAKLRAVFRLAYNTNGLAHHRVLDALRLVADLGYEGVAITPDVGELDPLAPDAQLVDDVRRWSEELGLALAIETGARYVLDAKRKHFPTLLEDSVVDRSRRIEMLKGCVDLAAALGAPLVSVWSGAAPGGVVADRRGGARAPDALWRRLCDGLRDLMDHGREREVRIAFEPEPGMFVERPAGYLELVSRLGHDGEDLGLTLDVGHLLVTRDLPVGEQIRSLAPHLVHVHLDDIASATHEHRMFGEGELDLRGALGALIAVGFDGLAAVELSRDSHRGAWAAEEAMRKLRAALRDETGA